MNPLVALGGVSVIALIAFVGGWRVASDHYEALGAKALVRTVVVTQKIGQATTQSGIQAQATRDRIVYRTQEVTREIPVYLGGDADLRLPDGFLRNYNDSLGLPSDAGPSGAAGAATGSVRADDALRTIDANNGQCVALAAQVNGLIDFYDQTKTLVNAKP